MLDLDAQIATLVDEAASEVTVGEARARGRRHRLTRVLPACAVAALLAVVVVANTSHSGQHVRINSTVRRSVPGTREELVIPKIGVAQRVMEGVDNESLKKGPGHDPASGEPGSGRNIVIVGNRTIYSHPFYDLDLLRSGDKIMLDARVYVVHDSAIYNVRWDTLLPRLRGVGNGLDLVTMNPKFSRAQTLIVHAVAA